MKKTVEVSAIMLRNQGDYFIVEAEIDGKWIEIIREFVPYEGPVLHIAKAAGILKSNAVDVKPKM